MAIIFLIVFVAVYTSCKKDESNKNFQRPIISNPDQEMVDVAKKYFNEQIINSSTNPIKGNVGVNSIGKNNYNVLMNIFKSALWSYAKVIKFGSGSGVVVPIYFSKPLFAKSALFGYTSQLDINNLYKLLVYKDSVGNFQTEVLNCIPDSSYLNSNSNIFTGTISVSDWNGNFSKRFWI